MKQAIATVKKTKEIQEKYKVFTKKSFGQNFIIEPGVVERLPMQPFNQEMNWFLRLVLELVL